MQENEPDFIVLIDELELGTKCFEWCFSVKKKRKNGQRKAKYKCFDIHIG